jgi:hypothetical protein
VNAASQHSATADQATPTGQDLAARGLALQQRADDAEQDRHTGQGHGDDGRFGMGDAPHDGHVEQHQAGRGDAAPLHHLEAAQLDWGTSG